MDRTFGNVATSQNLPTAVNDAQDECSICYEPFTNKAFVSDCLHNFCYKCINTWVQLRATCPLCLHPISSIITNVRSLDDYDVEHISPPETDVFAEYDRDLDIPDFSTDNESSFQESMSVTSNLDSLQELEDYEDELSGSHDNLSVPHSDEDIPSHSQGNFFESFDDDYCSDEDDELSDSSFSENADSSLDEDDEDRDDDDDDENHSENSNSFDDSDDENYDHDDNNNEDNYEEDDDGDNFDDNLNFSDSWDNDDDDDTFEYNRWKLMSHLAILPHVHDVRDKLKHESFFTLSQAYEIEDSDSDQDYTSPFNATDLVYSYSYY